MLPRESSVVVKMLVVDHVTGSDVVEWQGVAFSVTQILGKPLNPCQLVGRFIFAKNDWA